MGVRKRQKSSRSPRFLAESARCMMTLLAEIGKTENKIFIVLLSM